MKNEQMLHIDVDLEELAMRLIEARMDKKRPLGVPVSVILDALPEEHREWIMRQAQAAADYVVFECLSGERLQ